MPDLRTSPHSVGPLIQLYRDTHYDVRLPGGHRATVSVGQPIPAPLREFLGNAADAHLVSACNPFSVPTCTNKNRQRMHELVGLAKASNQPVLPGVGHIPGQAWRESFLLLANLDVEMVDAIARRFEQNAVVRLLADQAVRLRIYPNVWRQHMPDSADIEWAADPSTALTGITAT